MHREKLDDEVHDTLMMIHMRIIPIIINLRASRSSISRVKINYQWLLGSRTLESLAVLVLKSKVGSSLSNLEVKSSVP